MSKVTYSLNDDWKTPVIDEVYSWLMNAWDALKSKYDMEMIGYSWQGPEKGWLNSDGKSGDSIFNRYPSYISEPIGHINYSCSAWDRAWNVATKINDKIDGRNGVCIVNDDNVRFDLDDGESFIIRKSHAGPFRLPRILTSTEKRC